MSLYLANGPPALAKEAVPATGSLTDALAAATNAIAGLTG
jgi:hypothetical protein